MRSRCKSVLVSRLHVANAVDALCAACSVCKHCVQLFITPVRGLPILSMPIWPSWHLATIAFACAVHGTCIVQKVSSFNTPLQSLLILQRYSIFASCRSQFSQCHKIIIELLNLSCPLFLWRTAEKDQWCPAVDWVRILLFLFYILLLLLYWWLFFSRQTCHITSLSPCLRI